MSNEYESELELDPDERLFRPASKDWRHNAMLSGRWSSSVGYAMAFKEAGDMLVKQGVEEQLQDLAFFPALYCYRHALELSMKDVFYRWERLQTNRPDIIKTHDLLKVWRRTRAALEAAWPEGSKADLDAMEAIIRQLAEVDPDGEQFRYEVNRAGEVRELPAQLMRVDLPHVAAVMHKLLYLLWGGEAGIDAMDPGDIY